MPEPLSIGELAQRTGVSVSALRFYDARGLLGDVAREGGRRRFPPSAVRRVALVRMGQRAGLTLSQIAGLTGEMAGTTPLSKQWKLLAERTLPDLRLAIADAQRLHDLVAHCLECGCMKVDSCELLAATSGGSSDAM